MNVISSKFVVLANGSSPLVPSTLDDVPKYEKPAPALTYGRTAPVGTISCGPTFRYAMLFVVVRSSSTRHPTVLLKHTVYVSEPYTMKPPSARSANGLSVLTGHTTLTFRPPPCST